MHGILEHDEIGYNYRLPNINVEVSLCAVGAN